MKVEFWFERLFLLKKPHEFFCELSNLQINVCTIGSNVNLIVNIIQVSFKSSCMSALKKVDLETSLYEKYLYIFPVLDYCPKFILVKKT